MKALAISSSFLLIIFAFLILSSSVASTFPFALILPWISLIYPSIFIIFISPPFLSCTSQVSISVLCDIFPFILFLFSSSLLIGLDCSSCPLFALTFTSIFTPASSRIFF